MKTYNDIYLAARNVLRSHGIEAYALESRLIVCKACGKIQQELLRDLRLYTTDAVSDKVDELLERRIAGEPVAYLTESWEFYGLPMKVNSDVLIPRMDTEVLVKTAVDMLTGRKMDARILDLCCGSGCISCAIAHEMPATKLTAVDISARALAVTRENLNTLGLGDRVLCLQADATVSPPMSVGRFDMIVSNPPYIASREIIGLDTSVRDYEPVWALDGGEDGYKFYKAIIKYWKSCLLPGGSILFEVGENQADTVKDMLLSAGFRTVGTKKDTLGVERVVIGTL